ncbi:MAG: hypothetical protein JEY91_13755 [Spirochaetaceae bacterium]|nr:hypothetical protein [Spirochaetaceae bacterium]
MKFPAGLILLFLLSGCSAPPEDTPAISLFESFRIFFDSHESPAGISDLFSTFRKLHETEDLITVLKQGERVILTMEETVPDENTLLYTIGGNRLRVHQPVFITGGRGRKLFYSFDGEEWFDMGNNPGREISNIQYSVSAETLYDKLSGIFTLRLKWAAGKSERAVPLRIKKKEVLTLKEGLVFYGKEKEINTINLSGYYIKIPKGTEVRYHVRFSGNLVNSLSSGDIHDLEIVRDFYLYTTNDSEMKLGISLDGLKWNYNIFAFTYDVEEFFQVPSTGLLEYHRDMKIGYSLVVP